MKLLAKIISTLIFCGIRIYQKWLNPVLKAISGPNSGCRFHPTCSNYFLQAVEIHGPFRGSWLGICRICRCHPWGKCGEDPVPPKHKHHS
ncbi:membrane protein insertion efficiency factor YidD [Verrucomicrobiaceae bacterium N1E253]|uniref:Putative membrane protein insertion efficiency factor n=1 Tax=Oceaniferula marina TaxID=2748318 RepID=A0A851GBE7_9BACT|nr:membrane protein insertion efficiency factor YidD [Oceaniferula marina]NWK54933.1 membrane protein insertion efficiency factor YidD [Oceaniferula marina]